MAAGRMRDAATHADSRTPHPGPLSLLLRRVREERRLAALPRLPREHAVEAAQQAGTVGVVHLHLSALHGDAVGEAEPGA